MTKFQKIQKISSVMPVLSTVVVAIVTMIELKRRKAAAKLWFYFLLIFFLSGSLLYLVNTFVMTGQNSILNIVVTGLLLAIANILFVDLQIKAIGVESETTPKQRKMSNKMVLVICIIAGIAVIAGVVMLVWTLYAPDTDIADTNGTENTALTVITAEKIVSTSNDYTAFGYSESQKGEQTGVSRMLKDHDYDQITVRCSKISGIKTVQVTKAKTDRLQLEIDSQLTAGNLEILITVDGQFYKSLSVNETHTIELSNVAGKIVAVKFGAESAEVTVSVSRST